MALVQWLASKLEINKNVFPLGTIIHSELTEAQFASEMGTGWALMDGRSVAGSAYATLTGRTVLKDPRGLFLRVAGTNGSRTKAAGGNFSGGAVGDYANDKIQGHNHSSYYEATAGSPPSGFMPGYNVLGSVNSIAGLGDDGTNGVPRISNETAPASLSVNVFIKIN